jgi:tyrosine-protein kinase
MEVLAVIPQTPSRKPPALRKLEEIPTLVEGCQLLCAFLEARQATRPLKLVMVTSALSGEGKSTVAVLLASLLASSGKSVLLADANLRNPVLDQRFQIENTRGLADALREEGTATAELYRQTGDIPALDVLTAGAPAVNPAELLQSPALEQLLGDLREAPFDYIIFDTPALLPVADAQLLALHVQAIVLVIDGSETPRRVLSRTGHVLRRFPSAIGGVVLNKSRRNCL